MISFRPRRPRRECMATVSGKPGGVVEGEGGVVDDLEEVILIGFARRFLAPRQLDADAPGHVLDRLGEGEALGQREELEDVAARAAAEAVEESLGAVDGERRRLLAVERAESLVALAGELERRDLADEVDDVGGLADAADDVVVEVEQRHQPSSTATVAPSPPSLSLPGRHDFTAGCLRK